MNQASLELDTPAAASADRTGFDIGWDHAHHGLVPPAAWLHPGTPVCQGWMAGRAVFGHRVLASHRATRQWLQLRLAAWREGVVFDRRQVTPHYLAQIQTACCPVLRQALGGAPGAASAAVVERIDPAAGYVTGNLVVISQQAARARDGVSPFEAVRRARRAEAGGDLKTGLEAAAWWRLAALLSFATPLTFHEAAGLPLALLPPHRVELAHAVQRLQALLTLQFAAPGWSARTRALAVRLPEQTLRHDFNLFVGALAPRVLEAGAEARNLGHALEDAWLHERVQRRWQHFVLSLGEAGVQALLDATSTPRRETAPMSNDEWAPAPGGWIPVRSGRGARTAAPGAVGSRWRQAGSTVPPRAVSQPAP